MRLFDRAGKDKLDLSGGQFPGEAALDSSSCADNSSSCEEAGAGAGGGGAGGGGAGGAGGACDTYVLTPARARTYAVLDALHGRTATIIEPLPAPTPQVYPTTHSATTTITTLHTISLDC